MKKQHNGMVFIGYSMMFFITLFIIRGIGDIFSNFCWFAFMTFFAISGIWSREEDKRYEEALNKIDEIEVV